MIDMTFQATTDRFDRFAQGLAEEFQPEEQQVLYDGLALKFLELVTAHNETGTPVATGRARAGWARALEEIGGSFRPLGDDHVAISQGKRKGRTGTGNGRTSAVRWIVNGVDYIVWLEYGKSDQAPSGFIRINLEKLRGQVRGDALEALQDKLREANAQALTTGIRWKGVGL